MEVRAPMYRFALRMWFTLIILGLAGTSIRATPPPTLSDNISGYSVIIVGHIVGTKPAGSRRHEDRTVDTVVQLQIQVDEVLKGRLRVGRIVPHKETRPYGDGPL